MVNHIKISDRFASLQMLLVLGDSFAARMRSRLPPDGPIEAVGWSGAHVHDELFRRWAIGQVVQWRPDAVLVIAGGNDVAQPGFRQRQLLADLRELALGLSAAGADRVFLFPIPPRDRLRHGDSSTVQYRRRRRFANRIMRATFRHFPIICRPFAVPSNFLGRDGVHPSEAGWQALFAYVTACSEAH